MQARYWLALQEGDRLWCTSGTGWAKSVWNVILGPWSLGTEIFFHEGAFDAAERFDLISRYDINLTVYDGYGQTENTLLVGNFPGLDVRPGSMDKPSPAAT